MLYDEITASSQLKIHLEGNTVVQPDHDYSVMPPAISSTAGCIQRGTMCTA